MKSARRSDHYSPQGYLRGFIHPSREGHPRPLWVYYVKTKTWREKSPSQVGAGRGFYDYLPGERLPGSLDDSFRELENRVPLARDQVRRGGFDSWALQRDLFVKFAAMLSARSPLFLQQMKERIKRQNDKLDSAAIKNRALDAMRMEIPDRWNRFIHLHWCLRYTTDSEDPFVASDQSVILEGTPAAPNPLAVFRDSKYLFMVPLSWDMTLFGSAGRFDKETDRLGPEDLKRFRYVAFATAQRFIVSPSPMEEDYSAFRLLS